MADPKKVAPAPGFKSVRFADVYWTKDHNFARLTHDYGDKAENKELFDRLVSDDWWTNADGVVTVEDIDDTDRAKAVKEREEEWESLKAMAKTGGFGDALKVFEELYVEKNKIVPPPFIANSHNRRASLIFNAKVERRKRGLPVGTTLNVEVRQYSSMLERIEDQVIHNTGFNIGVKKMSDQDALLAAQKIVENGGTEANLERLQLKRGMSQKLYGLCVLNSKFPEIKIVERMCKPPDAPDYIPFGSAQKETVRLYAVRAVPERLAVHNNKNKGKGEILTPVTQEDVAAYLADAKSANAGGGTKMLEKANIAALEQNNPNLVMKAVASGILNNNMDVWAKHTDAANAHNAVVRIQQADNLPQLEILLMQVAALNGEQQFVILKKLSDSLRA